MKVTAAHVESVLRAHQEKSTHLGSFPPPTYDTILAAEIVKYVLNQSSYLKKFAVSVTQLGSAAGRKTVFVVAVSGYHPALPLRPTQVASLLGEEFEAHARPLAGNALVALTHPLDVSYHPMHAQTQTYFTSTLGDWKGLTFDTSIAPVLAKFRADVRLDEVLTGVQRPAPKYGAAAAGTDTNPRAAFGVQLKAALSSGDSGAPAPQTLLGAAKSGTPAPTVAPGPAPDLTKFKDNVAEKVVKGLAASALAVRMGLLAEKVPDTIRALRKLISDLKYIARPQFLPNTTVAAYGQYAEFLEKVLLPHKVTDAEVDQPSLVAGPLTTSVKKLDSSSKATIEAWGANSFGRFCAEPKGYFYSRNLYVCSSYTQEIEGGRPSGGKEVAMQFGVLLGQLAFWYNRDPTQVGKEFSAPLFVHGNTTETTPCHGGYMLPCSSCAARSGNMRVGLLATPVVGPGPFPWMTASEKDIDDFLLREYGVRLDHTARQILVGTVIEHRKAIQAKPAATQPDFEEVIRKRALRMAIIL